MPFKVTARTILQLGGELISSDGIAFYELIKNAFDAGSKRVLVDVVSRLPVETVESILDQISNVGETDSPDVQRRDKGRDVAAETLTRTKNLIRENAEPTAKGIVEWLGDVEATCDLDELASLLLDANSISFTDFGHGMSLEDLDTNYLTVGTPHRKLERLNSNKTILGEKGIGRLSTMRLGKHLWVRTASEADQYWNVLEINWDDFGDELGQLIEDVDVEPKKGEKIGAGEKRGTMIWISRLHENWSYSKLAEIANDDIARLLDPFISSRRISVTLKFNGQRVPVPRMNEILTERSHGILETQFELVERKNGTKDVRFSGHIDYLVSSATGEKLRDRRATFDYCYDDLCGLFSDPKYSEFSIDLDTLYSLGPFTLKCYWFNRRLIKKITVNEEVLDLKTIIKQWSGGLALYRDGFRVPPYGGGDDDWLDLDRRALASQGYKVNRAQLVGKVDITAVDNPMLEDQTNREGLRDCPEKRALIQLCKLALENEFRGYLIEVDNELREKSRVNFGDLSDQLAIVEEKINESLDALSSKHELRPELGLVRVEKRLRSAYDTVVDVVNEMQSTVEATEDEKAKLLHLAALGLSVEKLAHELNRTTRHALEALHGIRAGKDANALREAAEIQLVSLQKRLQNLDPQLGPMRNRKEEFDLRDCLRLAVGAYEGKAERHDVDLILKFVPDRPIMLKTVRACILQVVHNLLDNSFYWLTAKRQKHDLVDEDRQIIITVNTKQETFEVYDNGPGIAPENKERVFREFYTLKRSGEGKGLGLFISRELLELYGGAITLSEDNVNENGRLTTFIVDFSGMRT
ncbi:CAI-1 autoinducer sensor kinase/phosphatase CqsS [Gimesia chilikensis]|uniref:histidine kinase n=1 Tax=Gimesia chilikensis TaxID=2605989 RepID=A0A517WJQ2_9PLAN|nr:sensor histidine kinase [Gimesia chilikensis]QDU05469.1 CAI-1 autoinducer sensor kinase/phosphatase CqsS [Gimesia chilikensis]